MLIDVDDNLKFVRDTASDSDDEIGIDQYSKYNDDLYSSYSKPYYVNMVNSLQHHYTFDLGFKMVDQSSDKKMLCQCPCSKFMAEWRNKHNIPYLV